MGAFLAPLITWLGTMLTDEVIRRGVKKGIYVSMALAAVALFVTTLEGLGTSILQSVPPDVSSFAALVLPRNLAECVGVMIAATIARALMRFQGKIADKVTQ